MGSPSPARHRCQPAGSHRITAPAVTLIAPQRGLQDTERTKRSRYPLLGIGSARHGQSPHTTPSPPLTLARADAAVLLQPRSAHHAPWIARRVTSPTCGASREAHLRRRTRSAQLQRWKACSLTSNLRTISAIVSLWRWISFAGSGPLDRLPCRKSSFAQASFVAIDNAPGGAWNAVEGAYLHRFHDHPGFDWTQSTGIQSHAAGCGWFRFPDSKTHE